MSASPDARTVALLGLRCSGKTTIGRLLAAELRRAFLDLDPETVRVGRWAGWPADSVGELLRRAGPARFRELEAAALRRVLEPCPRVVLATGGGVVERADNRAWLARTARCFYLSVPLAELASRLRADPADRPPLLGPDAVSELGALSRAREPHYLALAEAVIECGADPPMVLAARLRAALGGVDDSRPEPTSPSSAALPR